MNWTKLLTRIEVNQAAMADKPVVKGPRLAVDFSPNKLPHGAIEAS